jgi:hypothetical protein
MIGASVPHFNAEDSVLLNSSVDDLITLLARDQIKPSAIPLADR